MSDARLRQLERAALAGDPEAEARRLLDLVRSGQLRRKRVEAAAICGDEAARMAIDQTGYEHRRDLAMCLMGDLAAQERWCESYRAFGLDAFGWLLATCLRFAVVETRWRDSNGVERHPRDETGDLERWTRHAAAVVTFMQSKRMKADREALRRSIPGTERVEYSVGEGIMELVHGLGTLSPPSPVRLMRWADERSGQVSAWTVVPRVLADGFLRRDMGYLLGRAS